MYSRRIAGQHHAKRVSARVEAQWLSCKFTKSAIQQFPVNIPGQPVEHIAGFRERTMDLAYIAPVHHVRQCQGRGNLLHKMIRRLGPVANRSQTELKRDMAAVAKPTKLRGGKCG